MPESTHYWRGPCWGSQDTAPLVIFNNAAPYSNKFIHLEQLLVRPFSNSNNNTESSLLVDRISSATGGILLPLVKAATVTATPPSQIQVRTGTDIVLTSSTRYRRFSRATQSNNSTTLVFGQGVIGSQSLNQASIWSGNSAIDATNIELVAGEGLAFYFDNTPSDGYPGLTYAIDAIIEIGTDTFFVNGITYKDAPGKAALSIMNDTGSGVTITVVSVNLAAYGALSNQTTGATTANTQTRDGYSYRLALIKGYGGGTLQTMIDAVTASPAPSEVQVVAGNNTELIPFTMDTQYGINREVLNYPATNINAYRSIATYAHRSMPFCQRMGPNIAQGLGDFSTPYGPDARTPNSGFDFRCGGDVTAIILGPQEGVAIILETNQTLCSFDGQVILNFEVPVVVPPGGGLLRHPGMAGGING